MLVVALILASKDISVSYIILFLCYIAYIRYIFLIFPEISAYQMFFHNCFDISKPATTVKT